MPESGLKNITAADRLVLLTAEGFGLGMIPVAPGTFGSLWAFPIGCLLRESQAAPLTCIVIWAAMMVAGIPICQRAASLRGRKDPGSVVWDEITAFPLVFCYSDRTWTSLVIGFLLFRLFDIAKPAPVKSFERLPGGLGVMADDQIAAIYAAALLLLAESYLLPL